MQQQQEQQQQQQQQQQQHNRGASQRAEALDSAHAVASRRGGPNPPSTHLQGEGVGW